MSKSENARESFEDAVNELHKIFQRFDDIVFAEGIPVKKDEVNVRFADGYEIVCWVVNRQL